MSTPNFYKRNANAYYVLNDSDNNDFFDDYLIQLSELFDTFGYTGYNTPEYDRFNECIVIAERTKNITFANYFDFYIHMKIIIRSGYYAHHNFDFLIHTESDSGMYRENIHLDNFDRQLNDSYYDEIYNIVEDYFSEYHKDNYNDGLITINVNRIMKKICKRMELLADKTNKHFYDISENVLGLTAVFSNGEAMYHKIK